MFSGMTSRHRREDIKHAFNTEPGDHPLRIPIATISSACVVSALCGLGRLVVYSGILAVALREAREESGLDVRALDDAIFDIDVHRIPARGREPAHLHFDVRFLVQAEHDRFRVSEESHALAWVPAVGVDSLTDQESVLRMARKWVVRRADGDR